MLVCSNQLNSEQLRAVDKLSALCYAADGGLPPLYRHILEQRRVTDNNLLYFQKNKLVGFLSVYFFYPEACEVSVLVDPEHRRQGIAKHLIKTAMPLFEARQMNTVIFSTPALINRAWLSELDFLYHSSEYQMQRHSYEPILLTKQALIIRKATSKDIPALCSIDELCFANIQQDNMIERFTHLFEDGNYTILLALHDNQKVGKAHIRWQEEGALLSDIAIIPRYQGQGWGGELLANCINHALTLGKTKLDLDVETSNKNALSLYTRYGFKTVNAIDYWKINIDKLNTLLK